MRILITNDDGYDADGLIVLRRIAETLSDEVWSVAPEINRSGAGHSLTLHEPLRLREIGERTFAITGTPTDCAIMGVRHVMKDAKPDLILSGVNRGQNIADDVMYSGTIAAAREGVMLGVPSIALSQVFGFDTRDNPRYECTAAHAPKLIEKLWRARQETPEIWGDDTLYNLNFPDCAPDDVAGTTIVEQGRRDQRTTFMDERHDTWGRSYYWFDFERRQPTIKDGTDLWAVANNHIAVTPLQLNMTNERAREALANISAL